MLAEGKSAPHPFPLRLFSFVQMVHKWLEVLMRENNVTTITTTGHSLGGALAHVSGLDIAELLDGLTFPIAGWKTTARPKVTVVTFASPRVGNQELTELAVERGVKTLRVVNKGDLVPLAPGVLGKLSNQEKWGYVNSGEELKLDKKHASQVVTKVKIRNMTILHSLEVGRGCRVQG